MHCPSPYVRKIKRQQRAGLWYAVAAVVVLAVPVVLALIEVSP